MNIFIPIIITICISNFVGGYFTRGLYDRAVRGKQMPILVKEVPTQNRFIKADKIMSNHIESLRCVDTVKNIYNCIKT
jgi:hypothetical protein